MIALIFSCQINKRGRLAPASALSSSTSAAAAAALGGPGWKPPAGPGLQRLGRALNSSEGGGDAWGCLVSYNYRFHFPRPCPPLGAQVTSAPAAELGTHALN